jgi:Ca2+-binding RTX toxin-like protein
MVAFSQTSSQLLNLTVKSQLQSLYGSDRNGEYQSTLEQGARIVFPEGSLEIKNKTKYYYPSFESFDVSVEEKDGIYSIGDGTLTNALFSIYENMSYGLSIAEQKTATTNANEISGDIDNFFSKDWIQAFGQNSPIYLRYQSSMWDWASEQSAGIGSLSSAEKYRLIQNSLQWLCSEALANPDVALQKSYRDTSLERLASVVLSGKKPFNSIFTSLITPEGEATPWTPSMYTQYLTIDDELYNNSRSAEMAARKSGLIDAASAYLDLYVNKNNDRMSDSGAYLPVYLEASSESSVGPSFIPAVDYQKAPAQVKSIISDDTFSQGDRISVEITQDASDDQVQIGTGSQGNVVSSVDGWFWIDSSSESQGVDLDKYDSAASVPQGIFEFENLSFQAWFPSQQGKSAWLLSEQIKSAITNPTPYLYSPNFQGGYGWSDTKAAATYTSSGFSYIASLAFSGHPQTTLTIQSNEDGNDLWSAPDYAAGPLAKASGLGFDSWFGGVPLQQALTNSHSAATASNSSAWDAESKTATVVNRPMGPVQELRELPYAGYPAVQVGAGIVQVAAANSKYLKSGLLKRSTRSSWHNLLSSDGSGNVRFDDFSNVAFGGHRRDHLIGKDGDDELYGHDGNDSLIGGRGDDFISGGMGRDTYRGGPGKDFLELNRDHFGSGVARILDFNPRRDTLWFVHVDPEQLSVKGSSLYYADERIARFSNIDGTQLAQIVESSSSFVG